jgi:hypothetical protein
VELAAQRLAGEQLGVTAVVLGSRRRETITEAIELLGIDGIDVDAMLEQRLDDEAMRHFDGDADRTRLGPADTCEPRGHFAQARASTGKIASTKAVYSAGRMHASRGSNTLRGARRRLPFG